MARARHRRRAEASDSQTNSCPRVQAEPQRDGSKISGLKRRNRKEAAPLPRSRQIVSEAGVFQKLIVGERGFVWGKQRSPGFSSRATKRGEGALPSFRR